MESHPEFRYWDVVAFRVSGNDGADLKVKPPGSCGVIVRLHLGGVGIEAEDYTICFRNCEEFGCLKSVWTTTLPKRWHQKLSSILPVALASTPLSAVVMRCRRKLIAFVNAELRDDWLGGSHGSEVPCLHCRQHTVIYYTVFIHFLQLCLRKTILYII
jgi:hypothetical protein